jgi:Spy/CpxP family protein refolding chaperone
MKSRTNATLLLIVTFLMGSAAGAVSYRLYQNHLSPGQRSSSPAPNPHQVTGVMAKYLNMDDAQKDKLKAIVTASRDRYRTLSQQFRPQYDEIRNETHQQIRRILRPDQLGKFDEFLKEMDRRRIRQWAAAGRP